MMTAFPLRVDIHYTDLEQFARPLSLLPYDQTSSPAAFT